MLTVRLANCVPLKACVSAFGRSNTKGVAPLKQSCLSQRLQLFASESRQSIRRQAVVQEKTLKENLTTRAGDTSKKSLAFIFRQGIVAGASLAGLGALCYYGMMGLSKCDDLDISVRWREKVHENIHATYMYFCSTIAVATMSAVAISHSSMIKNKMMKRSWLAIGATYTAMICSGLLLRYIPYKEDFGRKQAAWLLHSGIWGALVASLCLLGGPVLIRVAWCSAGAVGGLSALAKYAPSETFFNQGGPLAIGLGVGFTYSTGSLFLPPSTAFGAGLYSTTLYSGLALFIMFLLYDTQRIIDLAEDASLFHRKPLDPINVSVDIYLDKLNIFKKITMILIEELSRPD